MDILSWLLATLGPTWGSIAVLAAIVLGPAVLKRMKDTPLKAWLTAVLAKLSQSKSNPLNPVKPADPTKPVLPLPLPLPLPDGPLLSPLKDILDRLRARFKDAPAAGVHVVLPSADPGHDVDRLIAIRVFCDTLGSHLENEARSQAEALARFRLGHVQQGQNDSPSSVAVVEPTIENLKAFHEEQVRNAQQVHSRKGKPQHWAGAVNVMGVPPASEDSSM